VPAADGGMAHVLVDCGVHAHDLGVMGGAVEQLKADTDGKLALVIMTHRHADHISGFGSARAAFETFEVERVWMSWFEDPKDKAALHIQAGIAATATHLQAALAARAAPGDLQYQHMAENALGVAKGGNAAALDMLHNFKAPGGGTTPVDYYAAGDTPTLPASLAAAALEATILGPPRDLSLVAQMDNAAHQYLTSDMDDGDGPAAPFARVYNVDRFDWPKHETPLFGVEEIQAHIDDNQPDALAMAAQKADNALNNQSLVVLFTFGGKKLLFVGDAQAGNWEHWLFETDDPNKSPTGPLARSAKDILGSIDVYKVGHHGSTNATPKIVANQLREHSIAMCSTEAGVYGESEQTAVPLADLLTAIGKNRTLVRSDALPVKVDGAAVKTHSKLPEGRKELKAGALWIDCLLD
jgi:beta-lactamase superfamily II metal-dependent hydrolase